MQRHATAFEACVCGGYMSQRARRGRSATRLRVRRAGAAVAVLARLGLSPLTPSPRTVAKCRLFVAVVGAAQQGMCDVKRLRGTEPQTRGQRRHGLRACVVRVFGHARSSRAPAGRLSASCLVHHADTNTQGAVRHAFVVHQQRHALR